MTSTSVVARCGVIVPCRSALREPLEDDERARQEERRIAADDDDGLPDEDDEHADGDDGERLPGDGHGIPGRMACPRGPPSRRRLLSPSVTGHDSAVPQSQAHSLEGEASVAP